MLDSPWKSPSIAFWSTKTRNGLEHDQIKFQNYSKRILMTFYRTAYLNVNSERYILFPFSRRTPLKYHGTRPQRSSCYMKLFLRILYGASYSCLKVMPRRASRIQCETKAAVLYPLPRPHSIGTSINFYPLLTFQPIMLGLCQKWKNQLQMK